MTPIDEIDNCLPQTQCQLCSYSGCRPYAEAIVNREEKINRCLPGGITTLQKLGSLLNKDVTPFFEEMEAKTKPPAIAVIREAECIGCTKCITACPVDAIIGAAKVMHTIINQACTGCELCIPACPVDCIDLVEIAERDESEQALFAKESRQRFQQRDQRLSQQKLSESSAYESAKLQQQNLNQTLNARQEAIRLSIARVKAKKLIS